MRNTDGCALAILLKCLTFFTFASRTDFYSLPKRIFFSRREIQWNYSCAIIRISHKQFLPKNFAPVELDLKNEGSKWYIKHLQSLIFMSTMIMIILLLLWAYGCSILTWGFHEYKGISQYISFLADP